MNKKNLIILLFLSLIYSCEWETIKVKIDPSLSLSVDSKSTDASASNFRVEVTSNLAWIATADQDWLTIETYNVTGDGTIKVFINENTTSISRNGTITIKAGELEKTITIAQKGVVPIFIVAPESKNVIAAGESFSIKITATGEWTITTDQNWASIQKTGGTGNADITVTISANEGKIQRIANIIAKSGSDEKKVVVTQSFAGQVATAPEVVTSDALDVQSTSAILTGTIKNSGGADVTEAGFYWGTDQDPKSGTKVISLNLNAEIQSLQPGTTYYFISYANNSAGTSYGEVKSFTTTAVAAGVSFSKEISPLLVDKCSGCHLSRNPVMTKDKSYNSLINGKFVIAKDATNSKLITKINSGHPTSSTLSKAQKDLIIKWITEGALNNK